ncbi:MAG: glycosyltransferase family 2 protein [Chloroflexota bacterium]|nr:glycosyltransferase family 2 protein [Chloroflexota bacterium]
MKHDAPNERPLVSVVIPNWNMRDLLDRCLQSILQSSYENFEVIVVDDGSSDGSPELVREKYGSDPRLTLLVNRFNQGVSKACNCGYEHSRGKYVVFTHSDVYVAADWLQPLVEALEADPTIGAAQGKILSSQNPRVILNGGSTIDYLGVPHTGQDYLTADKGDRDQPRDIFYAWPASMIVPKGILEKVGAFDSDYFYCYDDVDLGWRMWLAGYRIVYVPESRIWHVHGVTGRAVPADFTYRAYRNNLLTLLKNYGWGNLLLFFPLAFGLSLVKAAMSMLLVDRRQGQAALKGTWWVVVHPAFIWKRRRQVQRLRRAPDSVIMRLMARPSPGHYLHMLRGRPERQQRPAQGKH